MSAILKCCVLIYLGLAQILIGKISIIVGAVGLGQLSTRSYVSTGAGVWTGVWIFVTGIMGVCAGMNTHNRCLLGVHLAFSIVANIISGLDAIFFAQSFRYDDSICLILDG